MIPMLVIRCALICLIGILSVSTVFISAAFISQQTSVICFTIVSVLLTDGLAILAYMLALHCAKQLQKTGSALELVFERIRLESPTFRLPLGRMVDYSVAGVAVILGIAGMYATYWSAGQQLAIGACALGQYEIGERISRTVRVSERWNDTTLAAIWDLGDKEDEYRTFEINEAIANVYGAESKQIAKRFLLLGDRAKAAAAGREVQLVIARDWYSLSAFDYERQKPSPEAVRAFSELAACEYRLGNRVQSFNAFQSALDMVSKYKGRVDLKLRRELSATARLIGCSQGVLYEAIFSSEKRRNPRVGMYYANVFFELGFLIIMFRMLFPTVITNYFASEWLRRANVTTDPRVALHALDNLTTANLALNKLWEADETSKVMLELAETDDLGLVPHLTLVMPGQRTIA